MRKPMIIFCALALLAAGLAWAAGEVLSVQVREGKLRAKPSFLGQLTGELAYGERVTVLQEKGTWVQVRDADGRTGWLHASALSEKKLAMKAGDEQVTGGASDDELALAGKGFNDQVEAEYRKQNEDLDYTWVDRMEKIVVTPAEAQGFLVQGQVVTGEGGR